MRAKILAKACYVPANPGFLIYSPAGIQLGYNVETWLKIGLKVDNVISTLF